MIILKKSIWFLLSCFVVFNLKAQSSTSDQITALEKEEKELEVRQQALAQELETLRLNKIKEDLDEFSIVDKLSTMQFSSPTKIESVTFANSLRVKLFCFDTTNQTAMRPQKLQHQALMSHHQ